MKRLIIAILGTIVLFAGIGAAPASAAIVCTNDVCVVNPDAVATPLGLVTITVSPINVVTVQLVPTAANTLVFGIPFSIPPGPPGLPGFARTTIATSGGLVTIDTVAIPPGPPGRIALPNVAIITIHPPGPCRARTSGTTVVFTPIVRVRELSR
ncbi:MAG: hypothetical protein H0U76_25390 [Ktedonobacteraceae bacterium]|nr:hypothetical protein [Ktedonobacteraceae bacterium]MBA3823727.1 hypothetical protein [Ktedonobacterales bacterium]